MPAAPWMMPLRKSRSGRPLRIRQTSSQTSWASQYMPLSNRAPPRRSTSSSGRLNGSQSGLKSGRVPRRRVWPMPRSYAPASYPEGMDVPRRLAVGGPRGALGYGVAVGGTALVTAPLLAAWADVSKTTVVLAYLLVVTAAAAAGGLGPGITAAVLGFLAFDVLFLQPYHHVFVDDPQDFLSLAVYLLIATSRLTTTATSERRRAQ